MKGAEAQGAKNGALVINQINKSGFVTLITKINFLSGRIDTRNKVEFTYRTASTRMKLPTGTGFWPGYK